MKSKQPQNPSQKKPGSQDEDQDTLIGEGVQASNPGRNRGEQQDEQYSNNDPDQESPSARNPGVLGGTDADIDTAFDDELGDDSLTDRQIGNDKKPSSDRRG